ncbi:50S ribosomal protein L13 [Sporohalobacter salinus]|uniref:50S ribosomal protein L13 n=1 Tax=Sporohalobacter salinus TaxID=1494606 RepID=UPI001960DADD|nr:50S ribosomal protein L13 [Sporohalobacter salinus]MBM7624015.1 large subunit ribosomal protein L13 [Sporohalobacter salinus]
MTTYMAKPEEVERNWFVVDAEGKKLGRLASEIANVLRGKHKPTYTPHVDTGDYVIVVNAGEVELTGNKLDQKMHHRHSEYPGGLKSVSYGELLEDKPEKVIELAVKGMVPKNKLGRKMMKKLKIYADSEHPHQAQQPEELEI